MTTKLTAAIIIVSDTASKDASTDKCEPVLRELFANSSSGTTQWEVADVRIVPDDALRIQQTVTDWTDREDPINLVVTSGGTGFAEKDVTPEVCCHFALPSVAPKEGSHFNCGITEEKDIFKSIH